MGLHDAADHARAGHVRLDERGHALLGGTGAAVYGVAHPRDEDDDLVTLRRRQLGGESAQDSPGLWEETASAS